MITFERIDNVTPAFLQEYERIPMRVQVDRILAVHKIDGGLGGIRLRETPVEPYVKDLGKYEPPTGFPAQFDISPWGFFVARDDGLAVGAATVACRTGDIRMLDGREDLCILWDIRVDDRYKGMGIGTALFGMAVDWAASQGFSQMKIECQNNNVPAVRFYHKQGAVLGGYDEYFYYNEIECREEIALFWYLDLRRKPQDMER